RRIRTPAKGRRTGPPRPGRDGLSGSGVGDQLPPPASPPLPTWGTPRSGWPAFPPAAESVVTVAAPVPVGATTAVLPGPLFWPPPGTTTVPAGVPGVTGWGGPGCRIGAGPVPVCAEP